MILDHDERTGGFVHMFWGGGEKFLVLWIGLDLKNHSDVESLAIPSR